MSGNSPYVSPRGTLAVPFVAAFSNPFRRRVLFPLIAPSTALLWALMLALLFTPAASAQPAAPTFGLQAPSANCPNSDSGYTCVPGLRSSLGSTYTYLTEFDWALRADGSIVAVAAPAYANQSGTLIQFGCVALQFFLQTSMTGQPFGTNWATVTDADTSDPNGWTETKGPNGCTYEPTSNTGVVIVRNLLNSSSPSIETYSIINTGLMP